MPPTPGKRGPGRPSQGGNYESHKRITAERQAKLSAEGRDIGPIPKIVNPERRNRGLDDPEFFHKTYFPNRYYLGFGAPHRKAIKALADCTENGGLHAIAFMRGGGKTTLTEVEVIRSVVYGLRRFPIFVGAKQEHADRAVAKILGEFEFNDLLLEDFPEFCFPIRCLERINQRCKGQTCLGTPTCMAITDGRLVLPTIKGMPATGAIIRGFGLEGAIRGVSEKTPTGEILRPDLAVIDDAQTRESARSPMQTDTRERIICDDILELAGPRTKVAAVFLCTPIYPNDLSERFTDRDRHPEWQGAKTPMVEHFPSNQAWWDKYAEVRREGLRDGDGGKAANELYAAERAIADEGCVLAWPDRVKEGDLSAIQSAMNLFIDNPIGARSEYNLEPMERETEIGAKQFDPRGLFLRLNGLERGIVPATSTRLTSFVDVGDDLLWWSVCSWNESFGGSIVDYGTFPQQNSSMFSKRDPRPGLSDIYPGMTPSQRVYAALCVLLPDLLGRQWIRQNEGGSLTIERCLVDTGDGDTAEAVRKAIARFPAMPVLPSKGAGRSKTQVGVAKWKLRPGERAGEHWKITLGQTTGKGKLVQFDPDHWKTFFHSGFSVPIGGPTGISIFGSKAGAHELLAEHLAAEQSKPAERNGDRWDAWSVLPHKPDNDWFDTLVGCAVAASVAGVKSVVGNDAYAQPAAKPKLKLSELQQQRRREKLAASR